VTVFQADEVELVEGSSISQSMQLSMGMFGSATAFAYLRTGNYNPAEEALAYADVDVNVPSDTELNFDSGWSRTFPERTLNFMGSDPNGWSQANQVTSWGASFFGVGAVVGLRTRVFHRVEISLNAELVMPMETQMRITGRVCYKWEQGKGYEKVPGYNRDFSLASPDGEGKEVGEWSFLVQGELKLSLRPELAAGIWLSAGGKKAIIYASLDGIITLSAKFWAQAGTAALVLPADFYGTNCLPTHSVATGLYAGFDGARVSFFVALRTGWSWADDEIGGDPLVDIKSSYVLNWQNDVFLYGMCHLERDSSPPAPYIAASPPPLPSLCAALTVLTTSGGSFSDSSNGASGEYRSNSECAWAIQPDNGEFVHLVRARTKSPCKFRPRLIKPSEMRRIEYCHTGRRRRRSAAALMKPGD
jgi:hypothetical protein